MKKKALKKLAAFTAAATMLMSGMTVFADETYTTQAGDSLSKIAKQFYGDADKWEDIYNSNKDQIKNPNIIWANQTLLIPNADPPQTIDTPQPTDTTQPTDMTQTVDTPQPTDTTQTTDTPQTTDTTQTTTYVTSPVNAADASDFIQKVYALMSAQDYISMCDVDGSDEARAYVGAMVSDRAVYTSDGSGNGVGVGVYKYSNNGEEDYYFYYGGYAGGGRTGDGIIFKDYSDYLYYYLFAGVWSNDAPNGNGTVKLVFLDGSRDATLTANIVNGLFNGTVNETMYDSAYNYNFDFSFTANNGIPVEDLTQEYCNYYDAQLGEDEKIIAYDEYEDNDGWHARRLSVYIGQTTGILGFADWY